MFLPLSVYLSVCEPMRHNKRENHNAYNWRAISVPPKCFDSSKFLFFSGTCRVLRYWKELETKNLIIYTIKILPKVDCYNESS